VTVLVFELFGRDSSAGRTFRGVGKDADDAGRKISGFGKDADSSSGGVSKLDKFVHSLSGKLGELASSAGKGVSLIGAVGSIALTAAPYLIKAASAVGQVVSASVAAAPALLAFGAAGLFVKDTFVRIGPAVLRSLNPIPDMLTRAGLAASVLATRNLPQLASGFAKANFPAVSDGMNRIASATNGVIDRFLTWGKSTAGVEAIRNLTYSTGLAMEVLGPHVSRVAESFGNMIGRIAGVSLAAGESGLAGVLDRLSGWFDRVNAVTVSTGLATLKTDYLAVRDAIADTVEWVKKAVDFWNQHRTAIALAQDAMALVAIAAGVMSGNLLAVVGGTAALIIHHWSDIQAAGQGLATFFATPSGTGFLDSLRSATDVFVPSVQRAWQAIWSAVSPVLTEIWGKIQNQLIPALGAFIAAMAPVYSFMVDILGPVVASVWRGIAQVISGVVSVISGILNVFAALLTGNWSRLWQGVVQIASGAGEIVKGVLSGAFGALVAIVGGYIGALLGVVGSIPGRILGALGNLAGLLYQAGRNVIQGLINGIMAMVGAVGSAIGSVASKIRASLPFSPAKEGPLSGSGSPHIAGAKISSMIASGMIQGVPNVTGAAYQLAGAAGLSMPAQGSLIGLGGAGSAGPQTVVVRLDLRGDDTREAQRAIEIIRKAVSDRGGNVQDALGR